MALSLGAEVAYVAVTGVGVAVVNIEDKTSPAVAATFGPSTATGVPYCTASCACPLATMASTATHRARTRWPRRCWTATTRQAMLLACPQPWWTAGTRSTWPTGAGWWRWYWTLTRRHTVSSHLMPQTQFLQIKPGGST